MCQMASMTHLKQLIQWRNFWWIYSGINRKETNKLYKYIVSSSKFLGKIYCALCLWEVQSHFYNHKESFNSRVCANVTTLSKLLWKIRDRLNGIQTLKVYYIATKNWMLRLQKRSYKKNCWKKKKTTHFWASL